MIHSLTRLVIFNSLLHTNKSEISTNNMNTSPQPSTKINKENEEEKRNSPPLKRKKPNLDQDGKYNSLIKRRIFE